MPKPPMGERVDGVRPWIQTHTDLAFDLDEPKPEQVNLWDIAWSLGHTCRYVGQCDQFWSVAEHSLLVADLVVAGGHPELELQALLHDAEEAYTGDWSRPLKTLMYAMCPALMVIPKLVKRAIAERFDVVLDPEHPAIKLADDLALSTERKVLRGPAPRPWGKFPDPAPGVLVIPTLDPVFAAHQFYSRARELMTQDQLRWPRRRHAAQ